MTVPSNVLTYQQGLEAGNWQYDGLSFIDDANSMPLLFNYADNTRGTTPNLFGGLTVFSAYMATGDVKYLNYTKQVANYLNSVLPSTGLVPITYRGVPTDNTCYIIETGQLHFIQIIALLAREDATYLPLLHKLADAVINYCINASNGLTWYTVDALTGNRIGTTSNYLGIGVATTAQSLLLAYETDNTKTIYRDKALAMLNGMWACRNQTTNLIPEVWDVQNNTVGSGMGPGSNQFRYDDLGGLYVRALMLAYKITNNSGMLSILQTYLPALVNGVWDTTIGGGAFRYRNPADGTSIVDHLMETMYGVFIATVLTAEKILGVGDGNLYNKSKTHTDNTFMGDVFIKDYMVPHALTETGTIATEGQIGVITQQFPLGMAMLSQRANDSKYRLRCNQIINTLLQRHIRGDNVTKPKGYVSTLKTYAPYDYDGGSTPYYAHLYMFLPSYILYNSIVPSNGVTIDWFNGLPPIMLGSANNIPYWDTNKVKMDSVNKKLTLASVTGAGTINLTDMAYGDIVSVKMNGADYVNFYGSTITTEAGTNSYEIYWSGQSTKDNKTIVSSSLNNFHFGKSKLGVKNVIDKTHGIYQTGTTNPISFETLLGAMTTGQTKTVDFELKNEGNITLYFICKCLSNNGQFSTDGIDYANNKVISVNPASTQKVYFKYTNPAGSIGSVNDTVQIQPVPTYERG